MVVISLLFDVFDNYWLFLLKEKGEKREGSQLRIEPLHLF
jgi:hypothetical protein